MLNTNIYSPTAVVINTSGGDQTFARNQTLLGLDVFTTGDVSIETLDGTTITKTFPTAANGGCYPCRWLIQIRKIFDTATTVTDANLVGLR